MASGGIKKDQGQNEKKKIWCENPESTIFDLQKRNIPQKNTHENVIEIWNKIRDFCYEKIEKKSIRQFSLSHLYPKNVRAKVVMDFTSDKYSAPMAIEKNQNSGSCFGATS